MKSALEKVTKALPPISRAVRVPHTDADYRELVELLDRVTDEVGEDEIIRSLFPSLASVSQQSSP